jgi:hypothetical protein
VNLARLGGSALAQNYATYLIPALLFVRCNSMAVIDLTAAWSCGKSFRQQCTMGLSFPVLKKISSISVDPRSISEFDLLTEIYFKRSFFLRAE